MYLLTVPYLCKIREIVFLTQFSEKCKLVVYVYDHSLFCKNELTLHET